jgi:hypothetical protein
MACLRVLQAMVFLQYLDGYYFSLISKDRGGESNKQKKGKHCFCFHELSWKFIVYLAHKVFPRDSFQEALAFS